VIDRILDFLLRLQQTDQFLFTLCLILYMLSIFAVGSIGYFVGYFVAKITKKS
jgi:hypothetical protein